MYDLLATDCDVSIPPTLFAYIYYVRGIVKGDKKVVYSFS